MEVTKPERRLLIGEQSEITRRNNYFVSLRLSEDEKLTSLVNSEGDIACSVF